MYYRLCTLDRRSIDGSMDGKGREGWLSLSHPLFLSILLFNPKKSDTYSFFVVSTLELPTYLPTYLPTFHIINAKTRSLHERTSKQSKQASSYFLTSQSVCTRAAIIYFPIPS